MTATRTSLVYEALQLVAVYPAALLLTYRYLSSASINVDIFVVITSIISLAVSINAYTAASQRGYNVAPLWLHALTYTMVALYLLLHVGSAVAAAALGFTLYTALAAAYNLESLRLYFSERLVVIIAMVTAVMLLLLEGEDTTVAMLLYVFILLSPIAERIAPISILGKRTHLAAITSTVMLFTLQPFYILLALRAPILLLYSALFNAISTHLRDEALTMFCDYLLRFALTFAEISVPSIIPPRIIAT